MALWPHGFDLGNFATAWTRTHIDRYFLNTVWIAVGSWFVQIVVATTGGLRAVRPAAAVRAAAHRASCWRPCSCPSIVLLVPLYLTVVDVPILHLRLIDSFWAVWLPAGRERASTSSS